MLGRAVLRQIASLHSVLVLGRAVLRQIASVHRVLVLGRAVLRQIATQGISAGSCCTAPDC